MKLRHFSIRDLLWLTALCAVLAAWWIDRQRIGDRFIIGEWIGGTTYIHDRKSDRSWIKKGPEWVRLEKAHQ